jgi:sec-independent protein translocase protein TatA
MGFTSIWHWVIVLVVVLLLFGAGKIPRLMGDVAKGVNAFKKGLKEDETASTETDEEKKTIEGSATKSTTVQNEKDSVKS